MKDETEIALGVVGVSHGSRPAALITAPAAVEQPTEVTRPKGSQMATVSLSREQRAMAANLGISESELARSIATRGSGPRRFEHTLASSHSRGSAGLMRAHDEVDRAHKSVYDGGNSEAWKKAPDGELLSNAISELKAYKPGDSGSYDRLLNGVLHAMCLLDRAAPAFADTRKFNP